MTVTRIIAERGAVAVLEMSAGFMQADAYVIATASPTLALMRPFRFNVPLFSVRSYSLTAQITEPDCAPVSNLLDRTIKVAITRLGDRLRIGRLSEFTGHNRDLPPKRRKTLEASTRSLFGGSCDPKAADFWTGFRLPTPDGPPLVDRSHLSNLFLNFGHGMLGRTMSRGSGVMMPTSLPAQAFRLPPSPCSPLRFRRR